jgi:hypothetical protein
VKEERWGRGEREKRRGEDERRLRAERSVEGGEERWEWSEQ